MSSAWDWTLNIVYITGGAIIMLIKSQRNSKTSHRLKDIMYAYKILSLHNIDTDSLDIAERPT